MRIELDYNVITAEDRCAAVSELCDKNIINYKTSNKELEKVANYIIYGKTENGKSLPEAKQINTKHGTWKKKSPESLDAMMENVMFDEQSLRSVYERTPYTNPKPTISREKDADIPGMVQLWEAIDTVEDYLEEEKQHGRTLKVYYLRHLAIDLRKEQYYLKDLFKPKIHFLSPLIDNSPHEIDWFADSGYAFHPLHMDMSNREYLGEPNWIWNTVAEHTIDLTNPVHIYHILDLYSSLRHQVYDNPTSSTAFLLHAVECLVEKTKLSPARKHILIRKVDHAPNEVIGDELREKFGLDYANNYISTIWTQEICGAIAKTGAIDRDEWLARNHPKKWKICIRCHTRKLRDYRFFANKRNAFDGLSPICRECQKEVTNKK